MRSAAAFVKSGGAGHPSGEAERARSLLREAAKMQEAVRLVSCGDDIRLWDAPTLTLIDQFNPHSTAQSISSLTVFGHPDSPFVLSASESGDQITLTSCKVACITVLQLAEDKGQTCVSLSSNSQFVLSGGKDGSVNIWDLHTKKLQKSFTDHSAAVTCVSYNWNDNYAASGSQHGEIILHNTVTNQASAPFTHPKSQPVQDLQYSYFKKALFGSVSDDGSVVLWDANARRPHHAFTAAHRAPASALAFSPVNDLLFVTAGLDKRIILYDMVSKSILRSVTAESPLTAVEFMPDGSTLALGTSRGKLILYDLRMMSAPLRSVSAHKTSVRCLRFHHKHGAAKSSASKSAAPSKAVEAPSSSLAGSRGGGVAVAALGAGASGSRVPAPASGVITKAVIVGQNGAGLVQPTNQNAQLSGHVPVQANHLDMLGRDSFGEMFSPVREGLSSELNSLENHDLSSTAFTKTSLSDGISLYAASAHRTPVSQGAGSTVAAIITTTMASAAPVAETAYTTPLHSALPLIDRKDPELALFVTPDSVTYTPKEVTWSQEARSTAPPSPGQFATRPGSVNSSNSEPYTPTSAGSAAALGASPHLSGRERTAGGDARVSGTPVLPATYTAVTPPGKPAVEVAGTLAQRVADVVQNGETHQMLTPFQVDFIRGMIEDTMETYTDAFHRDMVNLQVEMLRQFEMQQNVMESLLERYSINYTLVAEIERLREENKKLRSNY
ncbi:protein NEDD1 isoform X2 [Petromyzon marinus]|uniref:protein NEDD1 isoform X2 n=1 Tax=Petromyzon marinus TaxID=7757 RepID=UPI003F71E0D4